MKDRTEIPNNLKWDLKDIYKDFKEMQVDIDFYKENVKNLLNYKNQLDNKEKLLEFLNLDTLLDEKISKVCFYLANIYNTNMSDIEIIKKNDEIQTVFQQSFNYFSFAIPELSKLPTDYLNNVASDIKFEKYNVFLKDIIRNKEHVLSQEKSEFLNQMSLFLGSSSEMRDILCESELKFEDAIDSCGVFHKVTEAEYNKLLTDEDRALRKNALVSLLNGYKQFNKTLATSYTAYVRSNIFSSKIKKFDSPLDKKLFGTKVDKQVYKKLIEQVRNNIGVLSLILKNRENLMEIGKLDYSDIFVPVTNSDNKYSIETSKSHIKEALQPLGEEYLEMLEMKYNDKSIDYMPNKDKVSGAYSSSVYGAKALVLTNYTDNYNSMSTLAHELGHAIHSEFSKKFQPSTKAEYPIFMAEITSIVNETLLDNYMLKIADKSTAKDIRVEILDSFRTTIFRQTLFAEFEDWAHSKLQDNIALSYEDYNNKYFDLCNDYYKNAINLPDELKYEWSRIPHFYNAFYVYQYATGMICALAVVDNISKDTEFYKKYIEFLKLGGSLPPLEALKILNIDLTSELPYRQAFDYAKKVLKDIYTNK